jgi:dTDP-4-amino-4,6-dideoxygalactose transaminase
MVGMNSRLDALQAAVLSAKLKRLDSWVEARRAIAAQYRSAFQSGPARLVSERSEAGNVYHLAVARVPQRAEVQRQLASMSIQTAIHYPLPCHLQDPYRGFATSPLPVAERAADEVLSLPLFPHMKAAQVARVCEAVHEILGGKEQRHGE